MRMLLTIWMFSFAAMVAAQSLQWVTGTADTSYSVHNEFRKLAPRYTRLQLPQPIPQQNIRQLTTTYSNEEGQQLAAIIIEPFTKQNSNGVVLVLIHGGGWRSGTPQLMVPLAERMALRGYTCVLPQYRLSTHALYPAAVHDLLACLRWVHQQALQWHAQPSGIVVAGHSAGGQLAALIGAVNGKTIFSKTPITVQAVIDMDGILAFIHPESGEGDDSKGPSAATRWFGAAASERPDLWQQASPLTHAGAHCPPFLFINSSVPRMRAGQADFMAVLHQYGIRTEAFALSDAPHSFVLFQPWLDTVVAYADRFIQQVLHLPTNSQTAGAAVGKRNNCCSTIAYLLHPIKTDFTCENVLYASRCYCCLARYNSTHKPTV